MKRVLRPPIGTDLAAEDSALQLFVTEANAGGSKTGDPIVDEYQDERRIEAIHGLVLRAVERGEHPDRIALGFALLASNPARQLLAYVADHYLLGRKLVKTGPKGRRPFWRDISVLAAYKSAREDDKQSHRHAIMTAAERCNVSASTVERVIAERGNPCTASPDSAVTINRKR